MNGLLGWLLSVVGLLRNLLKVPDLTDGASVRDWISKASDLLASFAEKIGYPGVEKIVALLQAMVATDKVWAAAWALLQFFLDRGDSLPVVGLPSEIPPDGEALLNALAVAMHEDGKVPGVVGVDLATILAIVQAVAALLKSLRE